MKMLDFENLSGLIPNAIDLSQTEDVILAELYKAARDEENAGLSLGLMLAQILRTKCYKKLRCNNFSSLCEKLNISDRKGRHLIATSLAWHDACFLLGNSSLPPPANFLLAQKVFRVKPKIAVDTYIDLVKMVYNPSISTRECERFLAVELNAIAEPPNTFKEDIKFLSQMFEFAGKVSVNPESADSVLSAANGYDRSALVSAIEDLIERASSHLSQEYGTECLTAPINLRESRGGALNITQVVRKPPVIKSSFKSGEM